MFERALSTTASLLFEAELITQDSNEQAINTNQPVTDRSHALMNEILKMIAINQKWYDVFLSVLRNIDQTGIDMADELDTSLIEETENSFTQHGYSHFQVAARLTVNPKMNTEVPTVSTLSTGDQVDEIADQLDTACVLMKGENSSNSSSLRPQYHPLPSVSHCGCRHSDGQSKTNYYAEIDSGLTEDMQNSAFAAGDVQLEEADLEYDVFESQQQKLQPSGEPRSTPDTFTGARSDYPQEAEATTFSHSSDPVACSDPLNENVMVPMEHTSGKLPPAPATFSNNDNWNREGEKDLKSQNKKLESENSILNQKIKQLEADVSKLQRDLKEAETVHANAMLGKQIEITNLMKKALESKEKELAALRESKEKELAALEESKEKELAALRERCANLEERQAQDSASHADDNLI